MWTIKFHTFHWTETKKRNNRNVNIVIEYRNMHNRTQKMWFLNILGKKRNVIGR